MHRVSMKRIAIVVLLAWSSMMGIDLFVHGGLLAELYSRPSTFLLPLQDAFNLIPIGYLSFLLLAVMLVWLMYQQNQLGAYCGLVFGMRIGLLVGGSTFLGLYSISTASIELLLSWFGGQVAALGCAGAVIGKGLKDERIVPLILTVIAFLLICIGATITLQSIG